MLFAMKKRWLVVCALCGVLALPATALAGGSGQQAPGAKTVKSAKAKAGAAAARKAKLRAKAGGHGDCPYKSQAVQI